MTLAIITAQLWGFAWALNGMDTNFAVECCLVLLLSGFLLLRRIQSRLVSSAWLAISAALSMILLCSWNVTVASANPPSLEKSSFELVSAEVVLQNSNAAGFWSGHTRSINGKAFDIAVSISDPERKDLKSGCTLVGKARLVPTGRHDRPWLLKLQAGEFTQHCGSKDLFSSVRSNYLRQLKGLSADSKALVAGLAIGDTSMLSSTTKEQMKTLSLTHLTAVSGANCAIVLALVYLLLRRFVLRRWFRVVFAVLALALYLELVGPQPSVLRAAFMSLVILLLSTSGRQVTPIAALCLASIALLVVNPFLAADYGFALSVAATAGILLLTPWLHRKFRKIMPFWLAAVLSASAAAQIWCAPILLQLQAGIPTYSLLANALAEPLVAPVTVLGLVACMFSLAFAPLAGATSWLASVPAELVLAIVHKLSALPFSTLWWPSGALGTLLLLALAFSLTLRALRRKLALSNFMMLGTALVLLFVGSFGIFHSARWPIADWQIINCDVGQGDGLVIRSQSRIAVVDVGRDPKPIDDCLSRLQIDRIDLLILTHFDADHVGGLSGALKNRTVAEGMITDFPDSRPQALATAQELQDGSQKLVRAYAGMTGRLGSIDWLVLQPERDGEDSEDPNDGSVSMRWNAPGFTLFTMADLGEKGQMRLVELHPGWIELNRSLPTVLKVSHHGSADQYAELIEAMRPDIALISVGAGNSYGHPTRRTLKILQNTGSSIFRTDQMGAISVASEPGSHRLSVATGG